jgi:hypothetical protein
LGWSHGDKEAFLLHGSFLIKDGSEIHFWKDKWLGNTTLREQYPALYAIVDRKGYTIAHVLVSNLLNMTFKRSLFVPRLVSCDALLQRLANVQLTNRKYKFSWNLHENGKFLVASMYNAVDPIRLTSS